MKINLIIPPSPWLISDLSIPSYGVLYLSAYLKKYGHEVIVTDLSGLTKDLWKIPIADMYGITGSTPHYSLILEISKILKDREPKKIIIAGGPHATAHPTSLLNYVDYCCIGEGEKTILDLANGVSKQNINNLAFLDNSKIIFTPRILISDLDLIPFPDLDSIDIYKYLPRKTLNNSKTFYLSTGRGCPYDCSFCASKTMHNGKVRFHSVERVINDINHIKNKYNVTNINFLDDTFILNKQRLFQICDHLKQFDINWTCMNRVDRCDDDLIKYITESNCKEVQFGFESGSDKILKIVNKKTTVEQAIKAVEICNKYKLKVEGFIIIGLPGETNETVEETYNFIKKLVSLNVYIRLEVFQPFPGCAIWNNPNLYNYSINKNLFNFDDYQMVNNTRIFTSVSNTFSSEQLNKWYNYLISIIDNKLI